MRPGEYSADLMAEWQAKDDAGRAAALAGLFEVLWGDLGQQLEPHAVTAESIMTALPAAMQVEQILGDDGEEVDGTFKALDAATFADLKAAVAIRCDELLRAAEHFKALACLAAVRLLDDAKDDDPALPDALPRH